MGITTSLLTSCWWSDLLWSFFCPFTIYQIKMDPDIMKQADQTTEQFIEKARRLPPLSSTAAARKPKFDWNQLKTFESRKLKFLEDARQRYVVKHQQAT